MVVVGASPGIQVNRIAIVLEAPAAPERILGRIHHEIVFVVVLGRDAHAFERNGGVPLARAKEATETDGERRGLAAAIDWNAHDLADLVVARIVDVLLVPMRTATLSPGMVDRVDADAPPRRGAGAYALAIAIASRREASFFFWGSSKRAARRWMFD